MDDFHTDVGSLSIYFGSMRSRKSITLIADVTTYADIGLETLLIGYTGDVRNVQSQQGVITSHHSSFNGLSDKITQVHADKLTNINVDDYDVIGIDEGQFFDDIADVVREWVTIKNKIVIIASLDGDWKMQPIGHVHELICLCKPGCVNKLSATCMNCMKKEAPYKRIEMVPAGFTGKIAGDKSKIKEVGGADLYVSLCMRCQLRLLHKGELSESI